MAAIRLVHEPFGRMPDGRPIDLIILRNKRQLEVRIITYGAIVVSVRVPDRKGQVDDIVLGYDDGPSYANNPRFFGCVVGRHANRLANGRFTLDGRSYSLATNNGPNHLHGGVTGWNKVVWRPDPFEDARGAGVTLTHHSPDRDEGYPGAVTASVTYCVTDENELAIDYTATTDQPTIVNLTQHSYFNLAGASAADVLDHELLINADRFTPIDETLIPTGELAPVDGTPFDFRRQTRIGARIDDEHPQLKRARGYDHNYVLNRRDSELVLAARVSDPTSGRTLEVRTTEPGMQFYSGNFLDGSIRGKGGRTYGRRAGLCLETQHFPDAPNHPNFPSTVLRPGAPYRSKTIYRFE